MEPLLPHLLDLVASAEQSARVARDKAGVVRCYTDRAIITACVQALGAENVETYLERGSNGATRPEPVHDLAVTVLRRTAEAYGIEVFPLDPSVKKIDPNANLGWYAEQRYAEQQDKANRQA